VALLAGDVLAIGRALKAWPLPLLHVVDVEQEKMRLSTCKETCQKRPTKSCGLGNTHDSPQLPAPYFFLKHFYKFIYLYFYDMFIFIKTFLYVW
jgi:hypothetical protein